MTSVMTQAVARFLLLPTLVAAVAIFVKGYAQPGDGFSAGMVASLGILLQYIAFGQEEVERLMPVRGMEAAGIGGLLLALSIAIFPLFLGEPLLTHFPPPGSKVIYFGTLELITAVAFDAGIFLLVVGFAVGSMRLVARTGVEEVDEAAVQEESREVS